MFRSVSEDLSITTPAHRMALADYELALQRDPERSRSLLYRGQTHLAMKQLEQGHADVQRSIELCPPDAGRSAHVPCGRTLR